MGDLEISFDLASNSVEVLALAKKYRDQKMDLADACVVRMSELFPDSVDSSLRWIELISWSIADTAGRPFLVSFLDELAGIENDVLRPTAKDKVFVSYCRRRRKESLISWPAAQTWACSERAN